MKKIILLFFSALILFSAGITNIKSVSASSIASPIISKIDDYGLALTGLTVANSEVLIYVDGNYAGLAENSKNSNWSYNQQVSLAKGEHKIFVIARDKTSLILSSPTVEYRFEKKPYISPTIITPLSIISINRRPWTTGLTANKTKVKIYIDGLFYGLARTVDDANGTASFAFKSNHDLIIGRHKIWATALNERGEESAYSNRIEVYIQEPMTRPTLVKLVDKRINYSSKRVKIITGLAKNNSKIQVVLDHRLIGKFMVTNDPSGTANFAYTFVSPLTKGYHLVYTMAIDNQGKVSGASNYLKFNVKMPQISYGIISSNNALLNKISDLSTAIEMSSRLNQKIKNSKRTGDIPVKDRVQVKSEIESKNNDILKIIENNEKKATSQSGLINEGKENQSKLKPNTIIFIFFLLIVIGWLLWVNREIVTEKRKNEVSNGEEEIDIDKKYK